MAHTSIQIQSYLFIISQPKISFQFLIFKESSYKCILANCSYLIGTVPILTQEKGRKKSDFIMCSYICKNLPVVMYRKFRNIPIFKDIPPICPYFLGFRVGKNANVMVFTSTYHYFYPVSHFETANGIHYL